jgi:hypothetical protein
METLITAALVELVKTKHGSMLGWIIAKWKHRAGDIGDKLQISNVSMVSPDRIQAEPIT